MIIKKSIDIFSIFILLVIFFAAVWPLIKSGSIIDYNVLCTQSATLFNNQPTFIN